MNSLQSQNYRWMERTEELFSQESPWKIPALRPAESGPALVAAFQPHSSKSLAPPDLPLNSLDPGPAAQASFLAMHQEDLRWL
jgi:hypothetical protein